MKLTDFNLLKKIMQQTTAVEDPVALQALRRANGILDKYGLTWERVFNRVVEVVPDFEPDPERDNYAKKAVAHNHDAIKAAFADVGYPDGGFGEFIESLRQQFTDEGSLSKGQCEALFKAQARANERRHR